MPDEKKLDPFKPPEPNIPGVPPTAKKSVAASGPQIGKFNLSAIPPLAWIITAVAGVVIIGGLGISFDPCRFGRGDRIPCCCASCRSARGETRKTKTNLAGWAWSDRHNSGTEADMVRETVPIPRFRYGPN